MRVGYVRCSTAEQNEARQMKMMEDQTVEKVFVDKASGKNVDRKDFKAMMAFVREGDTVIVESMPCGGKEKSTIPYQLLHLAK